MPRRLKHKHQPQRRTWHRPAEKDTITVILTKLDGTTVTKTCRKPQYGGTITIGPGTADEGFDETVLPHWTLATTVGRVNEELLTGDWRRGPAGTEESTGESGTWFR